jgi:LacI family transcriptional regulator
MSRGPVSIKDVADRAGVSVGTVSNALNRPEVVAAATLARVLSVIGELGFVRNGSASRLRSTRNTALGLVVVDIGNPFVTEVVRGAERMAEDLGYTLMLCDSDSKPEREDRHLKFLEEHRVAGILISPTVPRRVVPQLDALKASGVSVVLLNEPAQDHAQCSVAADDVLGGHMAGQHLLSLGRRRIVYVTVTDRFRAFHERLVGLRQAVAEHGASGEVDIHVVRLATLEAVEANDRVDEILRYDPDAVFCANDIAALGVLRGLLARGIDVPGRVALIGYDDIGFAAMASIPLSSIRQPASELGRTAARLLIEECSGVSHVHERITFRPELVARQTTLGSAGPA